jgi:hypothetical protein
LEKLETVVGGIWSDIAEQLSADGHVGVSELEFSTVAVRELVAGGFADARVRGAGVVVAGALVDWVGVEWGIPGGLDITTNVVGERGAVLVAMFVLLIAISDWGLVAILPVAVFTPGGVGSGAGDARFEAEEQFGVGGSVGSDGVDDSGGEYERGLMVGGAED